MCHAVLCAKVVTYATYMITLAFSFAHVSRLYLWDNPPVEIHFVYELFGLLIIIIMFNIFDTNLTYRYLLKFVDS